MTTLVGERVGLVVSMLLGIFEGMRDFDMLGNKDGIVDGCVVV